jgi:hypothetical protein
MGDRFRALWSGMVIVIAVAPLAMPATAQGQVTATKTWTPPRTPDGQPDLQGVWLSKTATPLERPKALEGKPLLTDEEVAELKARANRIFRAGNSDFAAGDAVFLTALANPDQFKSPTSTHGSEDMIEREFDHHTSLVVDPPDGHIPAMTPEARRKREAAAAAARRADGPEDFDNALRCIAWGVPRLGGRYGAGDLGYYRIFQTPGYVVLFMETGHEARIIPLDGRPHLSPGVRRWSGDSRGRWEGNTLVIETVNFSPRSNFMGSSENLHLTERLTRVAPDTIKYEMTFRDPTTWTQSWTAEMPLKRTAQQIYEYACHEGNYLLMTGMLSAAHAREKPAQDVPR